MCVLETSFETKDQKKNLYKCFRLSNKLGVF